MMKISVKPLIPLTLMCAATACSTGKQEKPNVLFIFIDDLRPVLGTYNYPEVKSPNIDMFASEGIQFNNAYCNVPVSGATRASLLTGLRPKWPERFNNYESWAEKDAPGIISLPGQFKKNGYTTVSNGKVFHHQFDNADAWTEPSWRPDTFTVIHSFDLDYTDSSSIAFIDPKSGRGPYFEISEAPESLYFDSKVAAKSIKDLKRLSKEDKPFFLAVGFHKPHLPFNATKSYYDLYDSVEIAENRFRPEGLPAQVKNSGEILTYGRVSHYNTLEFHHEARRAYYACVSYVDALVGKLLKTLEELDLDKNTIVVILGDHGWHLGEHNFWGKHNILYNALHVPLLIRAPGFKPAQVNEVVEFLDLYPTLCSLASVEKPSHLQGRDMTPVMSGKAGNWRNAAFSEWQGARTVTTEHYSYSFWFEDKNKGAQCLFDHQSDPDENKNVAGDAEYEPVIKNHKNMIDSLYRTF